jgi:ATP-dependent DNA ligase
VIARKDGEQVRLWARTTSDYFKAFTRIRETVAALPVDSAVIDGEAAVFRSDNSFDFEALRSRQAHAGAILVACDITELDGQDELWKSAGSAWRSCYPVATRRCATASSLARQSPAMGCHLSPCVLDGTSKASSRSASAPGYISGRTRAWLKTKKPKFQRS